MGRHPAPVEQNRRAGRRAPGAPAGRHSARSAGPLELPSAAAAGCTTASHSSGSAWWGPVGLCEPELAGRSSLHPPDLGESPSLPPAFTSRRRDRAGGGDRVQVGVMDEPPSPSLVRR
jgi:hypothetical protein